MEKRYIRPYFLRRSNSGVRKELAIVDEQAAFGISFHKNMDKNHILVLFNIIVKASSILKFEKKNY